MNTGLGTLYASFYFFRIFPYLCFLYHSRLLAAIANMHFFIVLSSNNVRMIA